MTEKTPEGFKRTNDGFLHWSPGWSRAVYTDPGEAIKQFHNGKLRVACNERSFSNWKYHPCGNAAKYDPDAKGNFTKCGHHSKDAKARKAAKQKDRDDAWRKDFDYRMEKGNLQKELETIVRAIATGHNDARSLCLDWVTRKEKLEEENKK